MQQPQSSMNTNCWQQLNGPSMCIQGWRVACSCRLHSFGASPRLACNRTGESIIAPFESVALGSSFKDAAADDSFVGGPNLISTPVLGRTPSDLICGVKLLLGSFGDFARGLRAKHIRSRGSLELATVEPSLTKPDQTRPEQAACQPKHKHKQKQPRSAADLIASIQCHIIAFQFQLLGRPARLPVHL